MINRKYQQRPGACWSVVAFLVICFSLSAAPGAAAAAAGRSEGVQFLTPATFSDVAERVSPAVVNIRTVKIIKGGGRVFRHFMPGPFEKEDPFQDFFNKFFGGDQQHDYKQRSLGSGFIIDREGFIVTNNHVVESADKIMVKLKNGDEYDAEVVGRDPNTDLALIKIKAKDSLPVLKIGDSDALKVGEWVVAIGSPFGFEQTVTAGIVSAKGRVIGSGPYDDFIQTDASINPGNSGGPLINLDGQAVGINTAIVASGHGIGFAIPVNLAKGIIAQLKTKGEVTRGWLGVAIQPVSKELADYYGIKDGKGVLVTDVFAGDPADKAGIQARDIILEVNNKKIEESRDLTRMVAGFGVGETITLKVLRNGQEKLFRVQIAKREEAKISARRPEKKDEDELGIRVADLSAETARRFNIDDSEGVIVVEVENGSKGEEAGVQAGDIIKEVNHRPLKSVADYNRAIAEVSSGSALQLFIRRMNTGYMVVQLVK